MLLELEQQTRLGPASVVRIVGNRMQLEFPDELVWAAVALAFPYQPAIGDTVLAIGQAGSWYVIGLLDGSGKSNLLVQGDLSIQAPFGKIELIAAKGVRIKSPAVQIVAGKLDIFAKSVSERFTNATRWVRETFRIRSGNVRTRVEGKYDIKAERILQRADQDVKIDGRKIHLG